MQEYVQILGDVIRQERLKAGITQGELAEHAGIDSRTVLKIENHKGNPKMEVLYPLLRALNIDANRIFILISTNTAPPENNFNSSFPTVPMKRSTRFIRSVKPFFPS